MLILAQHRIPPGTLVRVIAEGKLILAKVVHCNRDGARFKIGVKIDQIELVRNERAEDRGIWHVFMAAIFRRLVPKTYERSA
jgi:hypothetical protein